MTQLADDDAKQIPPSVTQGPGLGSGGVSRRTEHASAR